MDRLELKFRHLSTALQNDFNLSSLGRKVRTCTKESRWSCGSEPCLTQIQRPESIVNRLGGQNRLDAIAVVCVRTGLPGPGDEIWVTLTSLSVKMNGFCLVSFLGFSLCFRMFWWLSLSGWFGCYSKSQIQTDLSLLSINSTALIQHGFRPTQFERIQFL